MTLRNTISILTAYVLLFILGFIPIVNNIIPTNSLYWYGTVIGMMLHFIIEFYDGDENENGLH